jgi:hypothetical protein
MASFYTDITFLEVNKRINFLVKAKQDIIIYFNNIDHDQPFDTIENEVAQRKRQEINLYLKKLRLNIISAGVNTEMYYSPPPLLGGIRGNIDLFSNIFNLNTYRLDPRTIIDIIDQTVGIYNDEKIKAFIRTLNPFWWIWKIIRWIASLPFFILKEIGFNTEKIESNIVGKLIKLIVEVAIFLEASFAILSAFGYEDLVIKNIKSIFKLP